MNPIRIQDLIPEERVRQYSATPPSDEWIYAYVGKGIMHEPCGGKWFREPKPVEDRSPKHHLPLHLGAPYYFSDDEYVGSNGVYYLVVEDRSLRASPTWADMPTDGLRVIESNHVHYVPRTLIDIVNKWKEGHVNRIGVFSAKVLHTYPTDGTPHIGKVSYTQHSEGQITMTCGNGRTLCPISVCSGYGGSGSFHMGVCRDFMLNKHEHGSVTGITEYLVNEYNKFLAELTNGNSNNTPQGQ